MTRHSQRWRQLRFALLLGAPLLSVSYAVLAQELEGNIAGEIRLPGGTFPTEQMRVTLETHGAVVAVTYCDLEGRFGFNNLLTNQYTVVIQPPGYQAVRLPVYVNPSISQLNIVHAELVANSTENAAGAGGPPGGGDADIVAAADLLKKYPPEVKKEFNAGLKAEQQNNTASEIKHYQAALRLAPHFYQAHNNLGGAYIKKGDMKSAESELRRALQLDPNSAQAEFNLGNVLYLTGREAEAKKMLEEGLRHRPGSAMGRYFLGCVLVRLREFGPAEEQLKSARQLDPRMPEVSIALATLYLQTGRQPEAIQMFEDFLQKFPENPLAPKVRAAVEKLSSQASAPSPASHP